MFVIVVRMPQSKASTTSCTRDGCAVWCRMPYDKAGKAAAKKFTANLRATTHCEDCGAQPVEWHNDTHLANGNLRVSRLTALGFPIARIQREIKDSTALCRRCHMKRDGRMATLADIHPYRKGVVYVGLLPCTNCGTPAKPLRRGLCNRCNHAVRYAKYKAEGRGYGHGDY